MLYKSISARRTTGKLAAIDTPTLEKYGYFIELMLKFPKFYAVVHNDYYTNGSKSGWSLTKVDICFVFVEC